MSNSLDPDQARRIVRPELGPNCLPRLSADDTGRQELMFYGRVSSIENDAYLLNCKDQIGPLGSRCSRIKVCNVCPGVAVRKLN